MLRNATLADLFTLHEWKNIIRINNARNRLHMPASWVLRAFISSVKIRNMVNNAGKK